MLDSEKAHRIVDVLEYVLVLLRLPHYAVRAHCHHRRRHRPDVQIVH
jgi:hypothetical protein